MSDATLSLVLAIVFIAVMAGVRYFKTLEARFWSWARTPLVAGVVSGLVIFRLVTFESSILHFLVVGCVMIAAMFYVRRTGDEPEPIEGMILGAVTGAAATFVSLGLEHELRHVSECLLAATVAGVGITFGSRYVSDLTKRIVTDVVTFAVAVLGAATPLLSERLGAAPRSMTIGVAIAIPVIILIAVFHQWPQLRAELRDEASLGFFEATEVRSVTHPLLRLGRNRWVDLSARREYVRLANKLALRKRQQRGRPEEVARLHQLEIIKIRMVLQDIATVEHLQKRRARGPAELTTE
jgi:hypothetical protein